MRWNIPALRPPEASGTGFCADAAGAAARPAGTGAGRLHHTGCSRGCGTGVFPGAVLFGVQSYAAALSSAGVLRWYMVLAAFAAALCTAAVLGIPVRWAGRCLAWVLGAPVRLARQWVLRPLAVRHAARRAARKERRNAKRTAKNPKKNLPNQRRVLYNSNVSK